MDTDNAVLKIKVQLEQTRAVVGTYGNNDDNNNDVFIPTVL